MHQLQVVSVVVKLDAVSSDDIANWLDIQCEQCWPQHGSLRHSCITRVVFLCSLTNHNPVCGPADRMQPTVGRHPEYHNAC